MHTVIVDEEHRQKQMANMINQSMRRCRIGKVVKKGGLILPKYLYQKYPTYPRFPDKKARDAFLDMMKAISSDKNIVFPKRS